MIEGSTRSPLERGLSWLRVAIWADLVLVLLQVVAYQALWSLLGSQQQAAVERALGTSSLALDLLVCASWAFLLRAAPAERRRVLIATFVLEVLAFVISLAFEVMPYGGIPETWVPASNVVFIAVFPVSWLALRGLARDRRTEISSRATTLMWTVVAVRVLVWAAHLQGASLLHAFSPGAYATAQVVLRSIGIAVALARCALFLWLLAQLRSPRIAAPDTAQSTQAQGGGSDDDVLYGVLWLGGGLFVTIGSFLVASGGSGGGRYMITTGAIAYGVVRLARGLGRR